MKEPTWAVIEEAMTKKLEAMRRELEMDIPEDQTIRLRARIYAIKQLLAIKDELNPPEAPIESIY